MEETTRPKIRPGQKWATGISDRSDDICATIQSPIGTVGIDSESAGSHDRMIVDPHLDIGLWAPVPGPWSIVDDPADMPRKLEVENQWGRWIWTLSWPCWEGDPRQCFRRMPGADARCVLAEGHETPFAVGQWTEGAAMFGWVLISVRSASPRTEEPDPLV